MSRENERTSPDQLKQAMRTLAMRDTPANREAAYSLLLEAELIVPTDDAEPGDHVAGSNDSLRLIVVQDEDGKTVWPAFSDEQALVEWKPQGGAYAQLPARVLFRMMVESDADRLMINPGSTIAGFVTRHEARILADGAVPVPASAQAMRINLQRDMRMMIGSPKEPPPPQAIARIREQLIQHDEIEQAFLFLGAMEGSELHWVLGLRLTKRMDERVFAAMSEAIGTSAVAELGKDAYLDLLSIDDELLETLRSTMTPVYSRDHA